MAELAGIKQSISSAWQYINQTGVMDLSRGLETDSWHRSLRNANREINEATRSLIREDNRDAYGLLEDMFIDQLWQSILAIKDPSYGIIIITRLGAQYSEMADHVRRADNVMSRRHNGFRVNELHRMTNMILITSPSQRTQVEQAAARDGDPIPNRISNAHAELYQRVVLEAIRRSHREQIAHRNEGDAVIGAFTGSMLPSLNPVDMIVDNRHGSALESLLGSANPLTGADPAHGAGMFISIITAVNDAVQAHYRYNDSEYRLNYWIYQVCLEENNNQATAARAQQRHLREIAQQMNRWIDWLQRHQDHPSYDPPGGTYQMPNDTSLNSLDHSRASSSNHNGPVRGSLRGYGNRGNVCTESN